MAAESAWGAARPPVIRQPVTARRKFRDEQKFQMVDEQDPSADSAFQSLIPKINEEVQKGLARLAQLDRSNEMVFQAELYDFMRFRRDANQVKKGGPNAHALLAKVLMDINARALGLPFQFKQDAPNFTAISYLEKGMLDRKLVVDSHEKALSEFSSVPANGIYQQEIAFIKDLIVTSKETLSQIELKIKRYKTELDPRNVPLIVSSISEIDLGIMNFGEQFNVHLAKLTNTPFTSAYIPFLQKHYVLKGIKNGS